MSTIVFWIDRNGRSDIRSAVGQWDRVSGRTRTISVVQHIQKERERLFSRRSVGPPCTCTEDDEIPIRVAAFEFGGASLKPETPDR